MQAWLWLRERFAAEDGAGTTPCALRAERGWSQGDLADRLQVSRESVNAIETGGYAPSLPLAYRITELFERTIEEIFVSPSKEIQR